jgi:hypothetical protein
VAREFNTANKGGRVYWVAFRFRMAEGTLVTSRWTTVQVALPSWSDINREERPPRYLPGETAMLRYDPDDPAEIHVSGEIPGVASIMIMLELGLPLSAVSVWLIRWTMRERKRAIEAAGTS